MWIFLPIINQILLWSYSLKGDEIVGEIEVESDGEN